MAREVKIKKLADFGQEFFVLGMQILAGTVELPDAESLRNRVLGLFEKMMNEAREAGHLGKDIEDAQYALAAYLDEIIKSSTWVEKTLWAGNPLQAQLFGESNAGVNFFDQRLPGVRREKSQALEVYYLCLMLGFQGKYRMGNQEQLKELVDDLRRELGKGSSKILSLHGARPDDATRGGRRVPWMLITVGAVVLAVVVVVVLYFLLASDRSDSVDLLQRLSRS